jgi:Subtilase family/FlgD Ig-like domain
VTLFSSTIPSTRARAVRLGAALLAAVSLSGVTAASAAALADLAGPLRDLALSDSPLAARVARVTAGRVQVEVLLRAPANAASQMALERLGARVHRQRDTRVEAIVPVSRLRDIALLPSVAQVRLPSHAIPLQGTGATLSEGVQLTNALSLQFNGITGLGASVAIIDTGFLGYAAAELPVNVTVRSFRADGLTDFSDHGTAVAEIVADMAPAADLSLLAIDTEGDVEAALDWCMANGVKIANMSLAFIDGPFDGSSRLDQTIDRARAAGILPVVAAGNWGLRHWAGPYVDSNADGFAEFDSTDDALNLPNITAGATVEVQLSWFETAGPTGAPAQVTDRDYDLLLFDNTGQQIARSAITQNGDDPPTEMLRAIVPTAGAYDVKILAVSSNIATGPIDKFQLFSAFFDIEPTLQVPETSLSIPGEAAGAMSVGATRGVYPLSSPPLVDYPIDTLEDFSSWGPTVDGRHKPDICGPDYVLTSIAGTGPEFLGSRLFGTSAGAPHVAGGAALLLSESASRTADQLQDVLMRLAAEQNAIRPVTLIDGTEASEDQAGAGRLSLRAGLDTEPPAVSISFPVNGSTITTDLPTIVGVATDAQTGVDVSTIILTLDGVAIDPGAFTYNPSTGVLTYRPPGALSRTAHMVTLQASDTAGNQSQEAVSNFRVGLPILTAGLHMISLPYRNLVDPNPASIFGVPVEELALIRWIPTDMSFSKYRIYPDPLASFNPPDASGVNPTVTSPPAGLGYFVNLPRQVVLNIQGETLADTPSYTINLPLGTMDPTGWNMIGNPYTDTVDWATVQFTTNGVRQDLEQAIESGVTEGILYSFVPAAGAIPAHYEFSPALSAVLKPMEGYWLHVRKSTAVTIYGTSISEAAAKAKAAARPAKLAGGNWKLQLVAAAPGMIDIANYLGVAPNASSGHDIAADVPEPPVLGDGISLYFPHTDWGRANGRYAQDMQARGGAQRAWTFEVACPSKNSQVTLTWPELNATVPGDVSLRLEDTESGRTLYMRTTTSYTYDTGKAKTRHFQLVAETGRGGLRIVTLTAAETRGGQVAIAYQLSQAASVSAQVANIAGRPIRTIVSGRDTAAGRNSLMWDLRSGSGMRVPAGTYILQLTARSPDGQAVKQLCPVRVGR